MKVVVANDGYCKKNACLGAKKNNICVKNCWFVSSPKTKANGVNVS